MSFNFNNAATQEPVSPIGPSEKLVLAQLEIEKHKQRFFDAGGVIQHIPAGYTEIDYGQSDSAKEFVARKQRSFKRNAHKRNKPRKTRASKKAESC